MDCWNSLLIAGSPKNRRLKKKCNKNNVPSKGKLKCINSAARVRFQVLNKVRDKLKRPKTI